jgi:hypothetical protein
MSEIHDKTFAKFDAMGVEKVDLLYRTNGFHVREREPAAQRLQRQQMMANIRAADIAQKALITSRIAAGIAFLAAIQAFF